MTSKSDLGVGGARCASVSIFTKDFLTSNLFGQDWWATPQVQDFVPSLSLYSFTALSRTIAW